MRSSLLSLHASTALPVLYNHQGLGVGDVKSLRQSCSTFRDALDASTGLLALYPGPDLPSDDEIGKAVQAMVARGCRPTSLLIALPEDSDASTRELAVRAFLRHASLAKSVRRLKLAGQASITPGIAMATLFSMEQGLKSLEMTTHASGNEPQLLEDWGRGVDVLLKGAGPWLERLDAVLEGSCVSRSLGALSRCTALTSLHLDIHLEQVLRDEEAAFNAELDILGSVCSLTGLRHLALWGDAAPPLDPQQRREQTVPAISRLSNLTGLTSLSVSACGLRHCRLSGDVRLNSGDLGDLATWLAQRDQEDQVPVLYDTANAETSALLAAVRFMPSLASLGRHAVVVASDLVALTSVTSLGVGKLEMPPGSAAGGEVQFVLPPRLRMLDIACPLHHSVAARLVPSSPPPPEVLAAMEAAEKDNPEQLPPPPMVGLLVGNTFQRNQASPWHLSFNGSDVDEGGALLPQAAASMRQAAESLTRVFDLPGAPDGQPRMRGLFVTAECGVDGGARPPPARAPAGEGAQAAGPDGSDDDPSHCASWLGSLAAVRPEFLQLRGFALPPRDMRGLAECMAGLKVLKIFHCYYKMASLGLLGTMPRLAELHVGCYNEDLADSQGELDHVMAAFMQLTAPTALPELQLIQVHHSPAIVVSLERAMAAPRRQLQQRGRGGEVRLVEED